MTWKEAFFKQAENDFAIFLEFNNSNKPICQQLHYLQMASEKLSKAFLCSHKNLPPKTTHAALTKFLTVSKGRPELRNKLGYKDNYKSFVSYIDSLLTFANKIEQLAPEGDNLNKPNPEYPWIQNGYVICPLNFDYQNIWSDPIKIAEFTALIHSLIRISK